MRMENDDNFNFLFNEEFEKIPFVFRFSKKRLIVVVAIMVIAIASATIFLNLFYDSAVYVTVPSIDAALLWGLTITITLFLLL